LAGIQLDPKRLFPEIRKDEALRAAVMTLYGFLILTSYLILKPVRDSLFLTRVGANQLPVIYILIAVIIGLIARLYSRYAARVKLNRMILWTYVIIVVNLVIFRWLLVATSHASVFYAFYIWVSIYGVITTSQFWLLANHVFNPREAKRTFSYLSSGAIMGGIFGGFLTRFTVDLVGGTENLLFSVMVLLAACLGLMNVSWGRRPGTAAASGRKRKSKATGDGRMLPTILKSRHLLYLTGILSFMVMVSTFVDFQFKKIATDAIPDKDRLTAFLGTLFSSLSLVSLAFQLVLGPQVLRRLGLAASLLFLPLGLLLGSTAMFLFPVLASAVALKIADGSFRYSINKVGLELLYLPIPLEIKDRVKTFIDMFADRFARGVGGAILLLLVSVLDLPTRWLSLATGAVIALWVFAILRVKVEYLNSFRSTLEQRELELDLKTTAMHDPAVLALLEEKLRTGDERRTLYALETLREVPQANIETIAPEVFARGSGRISARLLALLGEKGVAGFRDQAVGLAREGARLEDRADALEYLVATEPEGAISELETHLESDELALWSAALEVLRRRPELEPTEAMEERLTELLEAAEEGERDLARRLTARIAVQVHCLAPNIESFLDDPDVDVVRGVLESLGRSRNRRYAPRIIDCLASTRTRRAATEALAAYREKIMGTLADYMNDPHESTRIRYAIPFIYTEMGTQEAADFLTRSLGRGDTGLEFRIIRALNRLRKRNPDLELPRRTMISRALEETKEYYRVAAVLDGPVRSGKGPAATLLRRALEEKLEKNLEMIFRLLGLVYPPRDIYSAFLGVTSGRGDLRANAVEFLDNLLTPEVKQYLIPILEEARLDLIARRGSSLLREEHASPEAGILALLEGRDHWVRTCALYYAAEQGMEGVRDAVRRARRDPSPLVRETAEHALSHWGTMEPATA
jgi:AAA family ATP:ADP antiporter